MISKDCWYFVYSTMYWSSLVQLFLQSCLYLILMLWFKEEMIEIIKRNNLIGFCSIIEGHRVDERLCSFYQYNPNCHCIVSASQRALTTFPAGSSSPYLWSLSCGADHTLAELTLLESQISGQIAGLVAWKASHNISKNIYIFKKKN